MNPNTTPKILITEALPLIEEEKKILKEHGLVKIATSLDEDYLANEIRDARVLMVVYARITKRIIDTARELKGIVRYGVGVDNLDIQAASKRGIMVANVRDYCTSAVADHAFAILLALNRNLLRADRVVKTKQWKDWTSPSVNLRGSDLEGKVLGLVGAGKIGCAVATRAKSFGMKISAHDPYMNKEVARALEMKLVDLDTILRDSDFVSIHAALTPETRGLIGERELKLMKKTAYIVNVARGPIVSETALYRALREGWIAGAGLDVYEKEPPNSENPLLRLENVVLTPHIAYYTQEAIRRLEMTAVEEAIRILNDESPKNLVNREILSS